MKKQLLLLVLLALGIPSLGRAQTLDTVIGTGLSEPYGVAVDGVNSVYVTDSSNNRILKYFPDTGVRTNFAGIVGVRGYLDGAGYLAKFSNPQGIVAARGGFVVADSGNHRIRFVAADGTVSTLAGGASGFTDGVGTGAAFNSPAGVAVDAAGNIYVADQLNNAIRKIDATNLVTTVATGFLRPAGLAVGDDGTIYVADSGNHSIKTVIAGVVSLLSGGGSSFDSGNIDSLLAAQARFNNPRGIMFVGGTTGILISDSNNKVLRRIYFNAGVGGYSVETVAGTSGTGLVSPVGLTRDSNGDFLIADLGGNSIRRLAATNPQKPVGDPVIGTVAMVSDQAGNTSSQMTAVTSSVFNNDVVVAILSEAGTETFYTKDGTDPSTTNGTTPPIYVNGSTSLPTSLIDNGLQNAPSDITIKAISTASGRKSSAIVTARFQFSVANPAVIGNNPGSVGIECATTNALIYYTTDGSDPTQSSALYTLGSKLNIVNGTNDITLKVRAFKNGYQASRVIGQVFTFNNLQVSSIGILHDYFAGMGSTLIVPVEVRLNTNDVLRSLQFRVEITPNGGAPTLLSDVRVEQIGTNDFFSIPLPSTSTNGPTWLAYNSGSTSGVSVGFLGTNAEFQVQNSATVAMLSIPIPATATVGQTYSIGVSYPSGTSDGFQSAVPLNALTNRTITVTNMGYIVGDTAVARWYNAGDFGSGNLNNNDVNNAFYASLGLRVPYRNSDLFNALDAYPEDSVGTPGGDNDIRFLDWQTIFDRSLRLSTANWVRTWSAGGVRAVSSTGLNSSPIMPGTEVTAPSGPKLAWFKQATVRGGVVADVQPGSLVKVPVYVDVKAGSSISGLLFRAAVIPSAGAPIVWESLKFTPSSKVPTPEFGPSLPASVGCGWLVGRISPALTGDGNQIGTLEFTVPAGAKVGQSYAVRFLAVDGSDRLSTGGYANYDLQSRGGSVWVQSGPTTAPDVISDEWRIKFFGSLTNALSAALADPDGDGRNNIQEFLAGSYPLKPKFSDWNGKAQGFLLKWKGFGGKQYVVECTTDPVNGPWKAISDAFQGTDGALNFDAPKLDPTSLFYRVREVQQ